MPRDKKIDLEEARKAGKLDQFAKDHQSTGDKKAFDKLLGAMASKTTSKDATSKRLHSSKEKSLNKKNHLRRLSD